MVGQIWPTGRQLTITVIHQQTNWLESCYTNQSLQISMTHQMRLFGASCYWLAQREPTSFVKGEIITCFHFHQCPSSFPLARKWTGFYNICMALYLIILEQQSESLLTSQPDIHRLLWIVMQSSLSNRKCVFEASRFAVESCLSASLGLFDKPRAT